MLGDLLGFGTDMVTPDMYPASSPLEDLKRRIADTKRRHWREMEEYHDSYKEECKKLEGMAKLKADVEFKELINRLRKTHNEELEALQNGDWGSIL